MRGSLPARTGLYASAVIVIDYDSVGKMGRTEEDRLTRTFTELAQRPEVYDW